MAKTCDKCDAGMASSSPRFVTSDTGISGIRTLYADLCYGCQMDFRALVYGFMPKGANNHSLWEDKNGSCYDP